MTLNPEKLPRRRQNEVVVISEIIKWPGARNSKEVSVPLLTGI